MISFFSEEKTKVHKNSKDDEEQALHFLEESNLPSYLQNEAF
jgi:hypothetical protein